MTTSLRAIHNDMKKLEQDVALIKNILISEGELTECAEKELAEARQRPNSEKVPLEAVEEKICRR